MKLSLLIFAANFLHLGISQPNIGPTIQRLETYLKNSPEVAAAIQNAQPNQKYFSQATFNTFRNRESRIQNNPT